MPFVMICGLPSSGKTYFTNAFHEYLKKNFKIEPVIISETMFIKDKNSIYMGNSLKKL
jgi:uridine kinase